MKRSIRSKLTLYFSVIVILVVFFQSAFNILLAQNVIVNQKKALLKDCFYEIQELYNDDDQKTKKAIRTLKNTHGISILLKSGENRICSVGSTKRLDKYSSQNEASFTPNIIEVYKKKNANVKKFYIQLDGKFLHNNEEIRCLIQLTVWPIDSSAAFFTKWNVYISCLVLFLGIFIIHMLAKKLSTPIESIETVSKEISNLNFSSKANEDIEVKELSSLAQNINVMSEELQKYIKELEQDLDRQKQFELLRRNFVSSISHEMKTPLGLLQVYAENLKNNVANIDKDYYCETILEETSKLNTMLSQMLTTSSLSNDYIHIRLKELSLSDLCEKVILEYEPFFVDYDFKCNLNKDIHIFGDKKYVEQVLKNLINNAIQNTIANDKIEITLERNDDNAHISIFNQGKHINEEDLAYVWEAFYRADKSHKRTEYNNVGLGLYIVKTIIDKHNGKCNICNTDGGVCVDILFPIQKA